MLNVEVYIYNEADQEWQRLDLYENESVQFVDSIQDLRDPAVILTGYSKQFSVPASKTNNKAFRHFYNADIANGFDARVRADGRITINGFKYKDGQIKLNSVKLKDGKASSYSIVFYGDTSRLKDDLRDAKLKDLGSLAELDHDYTYANVKNGFQTGLKYSSGIATATNADDAELVYPFITHTKLYEYDSGSTPNFYQIDATSVRLDYQELKPAVKWTRIIEAIKDDFAVEFDTTGFIAENDFKYMYLWCHRDKGGITSIAENESFFWWNDRTYRPTGSDEDVSYPSTYNYFRITTSFGTSWDFSFDFTITGSGNYDVYVKDQYSGSTYWTELNLSGNQTVSFSLFPGAVSPIFKPYVKVVSAGTITAIDLVMTATYNSSPTTTGIYDYAAITPNNFVNITSNLPDMRIMDFLSSAFKMFNLVVERQADGTYAVETLNDYYAAGNTIDITEYVDPTETEVEPSRPFDRILFEFEHGESLLINERYRELGEWYGEDTYDLGNTFEDNDYEVKVGFEKILFERMINQTGGANTEMVWATSVDDNLDPYVGKPVVFYYGEQLSVTDVEWEADSGASPSTAMARCSNALTVGTNATLGFKAEIGEYDQTTHTESLFSRYWEDYIAGVYDISSRILKLRAVFPPSFILTYSLKDTIIYKNKEYFINEIDIDVTTGEADIELITKWL